MTDVRQKERGRDKILATARQLYAASGFHQSPMSELAEVAQVSVGQVYRLFDGKNAIIDAIVTEDAAARIAFIDGLVAQVETGAVAATGGFEILIRHAMSQEFEALSFEILAEAHRNGAVALTIGSMCEDFRRQLRRLACVVNPGIDAESLDAAEELLLACLFGLGHRGLSRSHLPVEQTAYRVSRMIVAAITAM